MILPWRINWQNGRLLKHLFFFLLCAGLQVPCGKLYPSLLTFLFSPKALVWWAADAFGISLVWCGQQGFIYLNIINILRWTIPWFFYIIIGEILSAAPKTMLQKYLLSLPLTHCQSQGTWEFNALIISNSIFNFKITQYPLHLWLLLERKMLVAAHFL